MKGGKNKMTKQDYQDAVSKTFEVYGSQLGEAMGKAREENPDFGKYETSPGVYSEVQIGENGITNISFNDLKYLEGKLQEVTGDSSARLLRTPTEWQKGARKIARFDSSSEKAQLTIEDEFEKSGEWLAKEFRRKSLRDKL